MKTIIAEEYYSHILFDMGNGVWVLSIMMGGPSEYIQSYKLSAHEISIIKKNPRYLKRLVEAIRQVPDSFREKEIEGQVWK